MSRLSEDRDACNTPSRRTSLPRRRKEAKLLHHIQVVSHRPVFDDLPPSQSGPDASVPGHRTCQWGDPQKTSLCVPLKVTHAATNSSSAISSSTLKCRSGRLLRRRTTGPFSASGPGSISAGAVWLTKVPAIHVSTSAQHARCSLLQV